jgi:hypothetical protein
MKKAVVSRQPSVVSRPAPTRPLTIYIVQMADRALAGEVVTTDLNDGSFVALMEELRRRKFVLAPRAEDDPDRKRNPFLFHVSRPQ